MKGRRRVERAVPGGPFRECERCHASTDDQVTIHRFTECGACGPMWLCHRCRQCHRDEVLIYGGAR